MGELFLKCLPLPFEFIGNLCAFELTLFSIMDASEVYTQNISLLKQLSYSK